MRSGRTRSALPARAGSLVAFGAVLVLSLAALPGPAAGEAPRLAVRWTAPYSGVEYLTAYGAEAGCRSGATTPVPPGFNRTTGLARLSVRAVAHGCGGSATRQSVEGSSRDLVSVGLQGANFSVSSTGWYTLNATWILNFSYRLNAIARCSCLANATVGIGAAAEIYGGVNGYLARDNATSWERYWYSSGGTLAHRYTNWTSSLVMGAYLTRGYSYWLLVYVWAGAWSSAVAKDSAVAQIDFGGAGEGALLTSVILA